MTILKVNCSRRDESESIIKSLVVLLFVGTWYPKIPLSSSVRNPYDDTCTYLYYMKSVHRSVLAGSMERLLFVPSN
jgi:hypothetical protein